MMRQTTMQYEQVTWYSERVGRDMTVRIYGHYGYPVIAFPCQNKQSDDFYNFGMIDALAPLIESGRMKLYCVDANDEQTVSAGGYNPGHAAYLLDQYHEYLIHELLPFVYDKQHGYCWPYLVGASMGGTHAANHFFRRPELFSGFISISASYDITRFFPGYMDEKVYRNSPVQYLGDMPYDHPYIETYNQKTMIVNVGDGDFEYLVKYTVDWLKSITDAKGIHIDYQYWDGNSVHDWRSWRYSLPYFLNRILP